MADSTGNPLVKSATIGTVLQLAMVIAGHFSPQIAQLFPFLGTGLGGLAGLLNGKWSTGATAGQAAGAGAVSGAIGGIIGTVASNLLGDATLSTIAVGGGSTAVAGLVGGLIGRALGSE